MNVLVMTNPLRKYVIKLKNPPKENKQDSQRLKDYTILFDILKPNLKGLQRFRDNYQDL